eukprot:scaffold4511_cov171-Amphora_coffeaeformis.AAC.8
MEYWIDDWRQGQGQVQIVIHHDLFSLDDDCLHVDLARASRTRHPVWPPSASRSNFQGLAT